MEKYNFNIDQCKNNNILFYRELDKLLEDVTDKYETPEELAIIIDNNSPTYDILGGLVGGYFDINKHDVDNARKYYQLASKAGNLDATFDLAQIEGENGNRELKRKLLIKSIHQGNVCGIVNLASLEMEEGNIQTMINLYQLAIDWDGDRKAKLSLGRYYFEHGYTNMNLDDINKGLQWLIQSASDGEKYAFMSIHDLSTMIDISIYDETDENLDWLYQIIPQITSPEIRGYLQYGLGCHYIKTGFKNMTDSILRKGFNLLIESRDLNIPYADLALKKLGFVDKEFLSLDKQLEFMINMKSTFRKYIDEF